MNPHIIKLYAEAHEKQMEELDAMYYRLGIYGCESIASTIGNAFVGKGHKPHEYPEKPFGFPKPLTEKEKQAKVKQLFEYLGMRKKIFDSNKANQE